MTKKATLLKKILSLAICALLALQLAACGTLLYPERRGQTQGEIDPAVAIFDGIGLIFFIVPGLVAYAIDFTTGAIYLPRGQKAKDKLERMKTGLVGRLETEGDRPVLHLDPRQLTPQLQEEIFQLLAGDDFPGAAASLKVVRGGEGFAVDWDRLETPVLAGAPCL